MEDWPHKQVGDRRLIPPKHQSLDCNFLTRIYPIFMSLNECMKSAGNNCSLAYLKADTFMDAM